MGGGILLSLSLNALLFLMVVAIERKSHSIEQGLVNRGYVSGEETLRSDYWTRVGWTNTLKKMNVNCDVCFFGNSITAGSDFRNAFPELSIVNLGLPGDDLLGMLYRIPMLKAVNPKMVFIMAGANDLSFISETLFVERYGELLKAIRDNLPEVRIVIQSVLPMNHSMKRDAPAREKIESANVAIESLARSNGCEFIDLYRLYAVNGEMPIELTKDGIHLKPQAYDRWAVALKLFLDDFENNSK